jgi:hypothetical protein
MAENSARLRELLVATPDEDSRAYLAEMLQSKHEGLQVGALRVLGSWGGAQAVDALKQYLTDAFSREYGWGVRGVAVDELAKHIASDDADWFYALYWKRSAIERHELRELRARFKVLGGERFESGPINKARRAWHQFQLLVVLMFAPKRFH